VVDLQPTSKTYACLIHAWAQQGNAERATRILALMCDEYIETRNPMVAPSTEAFAVVLNAHAKSKHIHAGAEAERLLQKMRDSSLPGIAPNTICYNTVINAWAQSGTPLSGTESERLLREMQNSNNPSIAPDSTTYNSVIKAYDVSRRPADAERIFRELQDLSKQQSHMDKYYSKRVQESTLSYNIVIHAWAKQGNFEKAEALLSEMTSRSSGNGQQHVQPDVITLTSVLEAWSRSGNPEAGKKADMYLSWMEGMPPEKQPSKAMARYKLAHICWRNSQGRYPQEARQRIEELGKILTNSQRQRDIAELGSRGRGF